MSELDRIRWRREQPTETLVASAEANGYSEKRCGPGSVFPQPTRWPMAATSVECSCGGVALTAYGVRWLGYVGAFGWDAPSAVCGCAKPVAADPAAVRLES